MPRPPIIGDTYDGEYEDEIEILKAHFFKSIDKARIVTLRPSDKFESINGRRVDAILLLDARPSRDKLLIDARALNTWFPLDLDRFLLLFGFWERDAYRHTNARYYSSTPPSFEMPGADLPSRSYYVFHWHALLEDTPGESAEMAIKIRGMIPRFAEGD